MSQTVEKFCRECESIAVDYPMLRPAIDGLKLKYIEQSKEKFRLINLTKKYNRWNNLLDFIKKNKVLIKHIIPSKEFIFYLNN